MTLPKFKPSHLFWGLAALIVVVVLAWLTWPRPVRVDIAAADVGEVRQDVTDEGRTRIHDVYVVTAPVTGQVQRISVEPGDRVVKGESVATIYPASPTLLDARTQAQAQAGVLAAAAALRSSEADLALARRDQTRTKVLFDRGYASPAAVDAANAAASAAIATVAARQAALKQAQASATTPQTGTGAVTQVRSPVTGRVLVLHQQSETVTPAGSPLLDIGDPAKVEIIAEFLSQDAVKMHDGQAAFVENWGGSQAIPAHITRIEPYAHTKVSALGVEEQRVNVIARLDAPASAPPLGHGFRVDLRVVVSDEAAVLRVPVDALVRNGADWTVFRVIGGKARLSQVKVGDAGGRYRQVLSGLAPGDRVVVFPPEALKSGQAVRTAKP